MKVWYLQINCSRSSTRIIDNSGSLDPHAPSERVRRPVRRYPTEMTSKPRKCSASVN